MPNNIKPFEELTLADDFMFYQVMQDDKICIGVLERLLKIDIEIRAFLDYINTKKPTDSFTQEIDAAVNTVKQNEALRGIYMCEPIRIQDAKWAARVEAAKNLLRIGLGTHEQIAQVQDLPLKKVQELAEEVAAENENK